MIRKPLLGLVLAAAVLAPVQSFADVKVRFIAPENYTDAGAFGAGARESTLAEFRAHFAKLGRRFLTPGQTLTVDVLNIDLAGHHESFRSNDVRIVREVTPPHVKLRYVLSANGKNVRSGEDNLTDVNFQMNPSARFSSDRYVYEKALLDDWFRRVVAR